MSTTQAFTDLLTVTRPDVTTKFEHWRANHNAAVIAWQKRQMGATATLSDAETAILDLAYGIYSYTVHNSDGVGDGFGGPHVLGPLLAAFVESLNYELGRLDGATLDHFARTIADAHGWDMDTEQPKQ